MIAKTFKGLENVLANELSQLGATNVVAQSRAVSFEGDKELMYRANHRLRTALRILRPVAEFTIKTPDELYKKLRQLPWEKYMRSQSSFGLEGTVSSSYFENQYEAFTMVRESVVDYFRKNYGTRPETETKTPQYLLNVLITDARCTISLDSSGSSLHNRGYRALSIPTKTNEVIAAGLLKLAGWDGSRDFVDPLCGSGTLLIEAAMSADNLPAGMYKQDFGFTNWRDFDDKLWESITGEEEDDQAGCEIWGADISEENLEVAESNILNAMMKKRIKLKESDLFSGEAVCSKPFIMTVPPNGQAAQNMDMISFYQDLGKSLKEQYPGADAWIFGEIRNEMDAIGIIVAEEHIVSNGTNDCFLRKYLL